MNQTAFSPLNWNFQTIDPALLESDGPYTLIDLWPTAERDSQQPEWSPESQKTNPFLLPYGQDACLPAQIIPALDYSFNFPEYLDPTALYTSPSPYSECTPVAETIQGSTADFQHYISAIQSTPEFHPILEAGSLDYSYSVYSPDSSDSHETEHSTGTQLNKEATAFVPVVEIESSAKAVPLSRDSPSTSSEFKEAPVSPKVASPVPTDTAFAVIRKEPSLVDDAPIAKSFEFIHHDGPRRRRDTDSDRDENCGYTVEIDARGKKYYQCKTCPDRGTYHRGDMMRHQMSAKHKTPSFECGLCNKKFTRPDALDRHMRGPRSHKRRRDLEPVDVEEMLPPKKRGKTSSLSYYTRSC